jgi:hypothetical protein
MYERASYLDV